MINVHKKTMELSEGQLREQKETPFRKKIKSAGILDFAGKHENLEAFEGKSDWIIRHIDFEKLSEEYGVESGLEAVIQGKKSLEELRDVYHVPIPVVDVVVGKESDYPNNKVYAYIITEKIDGKNVITTLDNKKTPEKERRDIVEALDKALAGFARYLQDRIKTDRFFLWDIGKAWQFMWGKRKNDQAEGLYMIDTDLHFVTHDSADNLQYLDYFLRNIRDFEKKYSEVLTQTRREITNLLDGVAEKLHRERLEKYRDYFSH